MDMYTDTKDLIRNSGIPLQQICKETGLGVRWLQKYLNDEFKDVGVKRLEKVRNYLLTKKAA